MVRNYPEPTIAGLGIFPKRKPKDERNPITIYTRPLGNASRKDDSVSFGVYVEILKRKGVNWKARSIVSGTFNA